MWCQERPTVLAQRVFIPFLSMESEAQARHARGAKVARRCRHASPQRAHRLVRLVRLTGWRFLVDVRRRVGGSEDVCARHGLPRPASRAVLVLGSQGTPHGTWSPLLQLLGARTVGLWRPCESSGTESPFSNHFRLGGTRRPHRAPRQRTPRPCGSRLRSRGKGLTAFPLAAHAGQDNAGAIDGAGRGAVPRRRRVPVGTAARRPALSKPQVVHGGCP